MSGEASSLRELSESQVLELIFLRESLREARDCKVTAELARSLGGQSSKDATEIILSTTHNEDLESLMKYDHLKLCEIVLA